MGSEAAASHKGRCSKVECYHRRDVMNLQGLACLLPLIPLLENTEVYLGIDLLALSQQKVLSFRSDGGYL